MYACVLLLMDSPSCKKYSTQLPMVGILSRVEMLGLPPLATGFIRDLAFGFDDAALCRPLLFESCSSHQHLGGLRMRRLVIPNTVLYSKVVFKLSFPKSNVLSLMVTF